MPLYEYLCPAGHRTERLLPVADRSSPQDCEVCHAQAELTVSKPAVSETVRSPLYIEQLPPGHQHFDSPGELKRYCKRTGWEVEFNERGSRPARV
jgi:putative FmdB family regulatory protein